MQAPGGGSNTCRDVDELAADRCRGRPSQPRGVGQCRGGAGEVEGHDRADEPGSVGVENSRGHVRQRGGLEVGVDVLDDGVCPVDLVSFLTPTSIT